MKKLLFVFVIALAVVPVSARVINVPDDYATIQGGIDAAEDGDTVLVQPGLYEENITTGGKGNISIGSQTLMTGDPAFIAETIIDGGGNGVTVDIYHMERDARITLQGFTIRNGKGDGNADNYGGGVSAIGAIYADLIDLVVTGNQGSMPYYAGVSAQSIWDVHLKRVRITDNDGGGILISAERASLKDCEITNNRGTGGDMGAIELSLERATFTDNDYTGLSLFESSNQPLVLNRLTIAGTRMIDDAGGIGLSMHTGGPEIHSALSNSIIYGNEGPDIQLQEGARGNSTLAVSFCDVEGGQDSVKLIGEGQPELTWGEGNIDSDPLFADPDSGDYHLTAESPCIDAGDPDSDLDPDGTLADMGAFYFHQRDIDVEPDSLEFATLDPGGRDSLAITIRNIGLTWLQVELPEIAPADAPFTHSWDWEGPGDIPSESEYQFWVFFHPEAEAEYRATLTLVSDDPDEDTVSVLLIGRSVLGVDDSDRSLPRSFAITAIHPNPFNGLTIVSYQLPAVGRVSLMLYDITGRQVSIQELGIKSPGRHQAVIDGALLPTGVYWLSLGEQGGQQSIAKVVLVR